MGGGEPAVLTKKRCSTIIFIRIYSYEWDLLRPTGTKTEAESGETKRITCPGCGAPLDVNASARCPYCGTVIQQQAQDWVISAIRAIKQQTL